MNKNSDKSKTDWWKKIKTGLKSLGILVGLTGLLISLLILWGVWVFPDLVPNVEKRGQWGDSFGFITALFTGLAFAILIRTLHVQQAELALQNKELKGQREQLQKQNFISAFFQLLSLHNDIVNAMEIRGVTHGRESFVRMLNDLKEEHYPEVQNTANSNTPEAKILNDTYESFLIPYEPVVGYYFRHLYNVVKFVDHHSDLLKEDTKRYTNLVRAQLSSYELGLLFYNCLSERGAKFKDFVEDYALLEDVSSTELIDNEHKKHYKKSAFGESV